MCIVAAFTFTEAKYRSVPQGFGQMPESPTQAAMPAGIHMAVADQWPGIACQSFTLSGQLEKFLGILQVLVGQTLRTLDFARQSLFPRW